MRTTRIRFETSRIFGKHILDPQLNVKRLLTERMTSTEQLPPRYPFQHASGLDLYYWYHWYYWCTIDYARTKSLLLALVFYRILYIFFFDYFRNKRFIFCKFNFKNVVVKIVWRRKSRAKFFYRHHATQGRSCTEWTQKFTAIVVYEPYVWNDAISSIVVIVTDNGDGGCNKVTALQNADSFCSTWTSHTIGSGP